jgi:uncharacterized protein YecE (DUF72 family)
LAQVWIGCCGFAEAQDKYFREFEAIEIQQTFYEPPRPATAARSRENAGPEFHFALKAWQAITHESSSPTYRRMRTNIKPAARSRYGSFRRTAEVSAAWQRTAELAVPLRAEVVLFQCPASFGPTPENVVNLRHFFEHVERHGLAFAWEPRGAWPSDQVSALCRELRLVRAYDPLTAGPSLHRARPAPTTPTEASPIGPAMSAGELGYFRLHGIGGAGYHYTEDDLVRLSELAGRGPAYVFFNNLAMLHDARRFRDRIAK